MLIYIIDDEQNAIEFLEKKVAQVEPDAEIHTFLSAKEALASSKEMPFDVAFLDIQMPGIDGITLAKKLKTINPKANLIFVTGYSEYTMDAFSVDASGYLLKPTTAKLVRHALDNLRYPIVVESGPSITIQCFGNFEIFDNGEPIKFKYSKSKELLAYLVDRKGAVCGNQEVIINLWEDDEDHNSYYRSLLKDVMDTLEKHGCADMFIRQRDGASIVTSKVRCDYYDYLAGTPAGINAFKGEYMVQYSWAEATSSELYWDSDLD